MSGLRLHLINERPETLTATLRVAFYRHGHACVREVSVPREIQARGQLSLNVDELMGAFLDTTYAYQFGPPGHDVVFAALDADTLEKAVPPAFYFPGGLSFPKLLDLGLKARAVRRIDDCYDLTVTTERFAQSVHVEVIGWRPSDNYFHLEPGGTRTVLLSPERPAARFAGDVTALNVLAPVKIHVF